jgi:16S rRNA G966 N2-methylase RsmD
MAKKPASNSKKTPVSGKPSSLVDTRVIYCGDNLEQLKKLPNECVDLIYIDPPFNSNRNYEVFWGETKEKRAFDDRHASTQAYIDFLKQAQIPMILFSMLFAEARKSRTKRC